MIDNLALGITHVLMLIAAWRLIRRPDLDREDGDRTRTAMHGRGRGDA